MSRKSSPPVEYHHEPDSPICFVIGFLSSKEWFFEPVSNLYREMGFEVHVHIPMMYHKYKLEQLPGKAECFLDDIYLPVVTPNPNRPVFIHSFSHNGATLVNLLWRLLDEDQKAQVKAIAFDSAPSRFALNPLFYVHTSFFTGYPKKQQTTTQWLKHLPFAVPRFCFWSLRLALKLKDNYGVELAELDDLPKSQLFFYSFDDTMVSPPLIDEFVIGQARFGKNVEIKTWKTGFHCGHHMKYKKEYAKTTRNFVQRVLAGTKAIEAKL
ncbi:unnamed protein product [Bursaphelenchus okinawaensis]|uniref:Uncharacterized protein n=1 Tax=Bursaphelenchus okinawaensis TaxID=465554 RepID=A0A811KG51_9BILA|nr:unnamed protein product [Bursaphelenchus okinawaensis]CAG9102542.1 unnamed protein product [Bursaphelenchus okinawaensis]